MSKSNLHALSQPEMTINDPLHELIRQGARDLIARAVETELEGLLSQHADIKTAGGRQAVVRNGHLPKRTIQTGVGDVEVQVPKVRDCSDSGIRVNSHLLPPYLELVAVEDGHRESEASWRELLGAERTRSEAA